MRQQTVKATSKRSTTFYIDILLNNIVKQIYITIGAYLWESSAGIATSLFGQNKFAAQETLHHIIQSFLSSLFLWGQWCELCKVNGSSTRRLEKSG
jgi:hypothetical protein